MKRTTFFNGILLSFVIITTGLAQSNDDCLDCHLDAGLTTIRDGQEVSMRVDQSRFEDSIHGDFECIDCHAGIDELPHDEELEPVDCSMCHDDAAAEYGQSVHARALEEGITVSANCVDCHGYHSIISSADENAPTHQTHLLETCGKCHSRPEVSALFGRRGFDPIRDYEESVHGRKLADDPSAKVATCVACHGSHLILSPLYSESKISKLRIPETCGQCHEEESREFQESIHYKAITRGHFESPSCNDCHGEHRIISPESDQALTHPSLLSSELCATCHTNRTMMESFGLNSDRMETYMKSYHGLAVLRGSPDAANCTSCHEVHAIRSSVDSLSAVHDTKLQETCGQCHPGANEEFVKIDVHPSDIASRNPIAYLVKNIYIWMIFFSIAGMILHNLVILLHFIVKKWRHKQSVPTVQRFQPFEVLQHKLLFISFTILVITGFALKFPNADWSVFLLKIGLTESLRALLHRIAAVVMIIISLVQLYFLLFTKKGRHDVWALKPDLSDITGFWKNMRYYLFLSSEKPKFGRFDYAEKFEYLALIWGVFLMSATGFILWFPEFFMRFLPGWAFEVTEVIHYFEAWLATLAIIFWHWFFVIYHPENYPVSLTWVDGKMTKEEHHHHHPAEELDEE